MPQFNPAAQLTEMDGRPLRTPYIPADQRGVLATLKAAADNAPKEKQALLYHELETKTEEAREVLTVGKAIIAALTDGQQGDAELPGATRLDFYQWGRQIRDTKLGDMVSFDNAKIETIKTRVAKQYASAAIVGQVYEAILPDTPAVTTE